MAQQGGLAQRISALFRSSLHICRIIQSSSDQTRNLILFDRSHSSNADRKIFADVPSADLILRAFFHPHGRRRRGISLSSDANDRLNINLIDGSLPESIRRGRTAVPDDSNGWRSALKVRLRSCLDSSTIQVSYNQPSLTHPRSAPRTRRIRRRRILAGPFSPDVSTTIYSYLSNAIYTSSFVRDFSSATIRDLPIAISRRSRRTRFVEATFFWRWRIVSPRSAGNGKKVENQREQVFLESSERAPLIAPGFWESREKETRRREETVRVKWWWVGEMVI